MPLYEFWGFPRVGLGLPIVVKRFLSVMNLNKHSVEPGWFPLFDLEKLLLRDKEASDSLVPTLELEDTETRQES